jgi:hypothetical protein
MTEVAPVDLKLRRAVHVHECMYRGILYVALLKKRPLGRVEGCVLDVGWVMPAPFRPSCLSMCTTPRSARRQVSESCRVYMGQGKEKQEDALLIVVLVPGLARPHVM